MMTRRSSSSSSLLGLLSAFALLCSVNVLFHSHPTTLFAAPTAAKGPRAAGHHHGKGFGQPDLALARHTTFTSPSLAKQGSGRPARGGAADTAAAPSVSIAGIVKKRLHQIGALAFFVMAERCLRPLNALTPLPAPLWGMFGIFAAFLALRKVAGSDIARISFKALEPGYRTLVKWATCFFVPALMALPVAVNEQRAVFADPTVVLKLVAFVVVSFTSSLWLTGKFAYMYGNLFGTDKIHFSVGGVARSWRARGEGKATPQFLTLRKKLRADPRGALDEALESCPAVKEDVYSDSFVDGCKLRFHELDMQDEEKLDARDLLPTVVSMTQMSAAGRGLSEEEEEKQAEYIVKTFSSDGKGLTFDDFLLFARVAAVRAYMGEAEGFGDVEKEAPDAAPQAAAAAPAKKAKPYDPEYLKIHFAIMGAALALGWIATKNPAALGVAATWKPLFEKVYMMFSVFGGFIIGNNLPGKWSARIHPMITCILFSYTCGTMWGGLSGETLLQVLDRFKSPVGAGGGLLIPLLQPLVICLGLSLYERRTVLFEDLAVILCTAATTAFVSLFTVAAVAGIVLNMPSILTMSCIPRSVTAALALAIIRMLGPPANAAFGIAMVQVFGLLGAALGLSIFKAWGWRSSLMRGLAMGATSAGLGTVSLAGEDPEAFGYSTVMFALVGALSTAYVAVPPIRVLLVKIALLRSGL